MTDLLVADQESSSTYEPSEAVEDICDIPDELGEDAFLSTKLATLFGMLIPFAGFVVAVCLLWHQGHVLLYASLLLGMYLFAAGGITIGYHRYFTHKSFQAVKPIHYFLAACGSIALEGPVIKWVAVHRCHHQFSDQQGDPHSPHTHGDGFVGVMKGFWHSHTGWLFQKDQPNLMRYVPDLTADRGLQFFSRTWVLWSIFGMIVPAVIGGLVTHSWSGALLGFLWGGMARIFLHHHITWSINSVCHIWGSRPYRSHDHSRNNAIFGILALGEGWHNNHHAFPTSARHGLRWWQIDGSYIFIRSLEKLHLAWDVKTPSQQRMARSAAR